MGGGGVGLLGGGGTGVGVGHGPGPGCGAAGRGTRLQPGRRRRRVHRSRAGGRRHRARAATTATTTGGAARATEALVSTTVDRLRRRRRPHHPRRARREQRRFLLLDGRRRRLVRLGQAHHVAHGVIVCLVESVLGLAGLEPGDPVGVTCSLRLVRLLADELGALLLVPVHGVGLGHRHRRHGHGGAKSGTSRRELIGGGARIGAQLLGSGRDLRDPGPKTVGRSALPLQVLGVVRELPGNVVERAGRAGELATARREDARLGIGHHGYKLLVRHATEVAVEIIRLRVWHITHSPCQSAATHKALDRLATS